MTNGEMLQLSWDAVKASLIMSVEYLSKLSPMPMFAQNQIILVGALYMIMIRLEEIEQKLFSKDDKRTDYIS